MCVSPVHAVVRLRRRRAGALPSAVGPRELLAVVSELVLGKGGNRLTS